MTYSKSVIIMMDVIEQIIKFKAFDKLVVSGIVCSLSKSVTKK